MTITRVTRHSAALTGPPGKPEEKTFRYGLGFPFQVAPRKAGTFVNLEITDTTVYGFLNGNDVVLFDDLSTISAGEFAWWDPRQDLLEVHQLSYDGRQFKSARFPIRLLHRKSSVHRPYYSRMKFLGKIK